MWDAIEANQRRSRLIIGTMGGILIGLGLLFGEVLFAEHGWAWGALIAVGVWVFLWGLAMLQGENVLLLCAHAHPIRRDDAPRLWNVVEEMSIAAGLAAPPKIYVLDVDAPNAFSVGREPERSAIVVTSGLLRLMTRDELQGVIAHEVAHIKNHDVRFMTLAAVMVGAIVLLCDNFFRALWVQGARRRIPSRAGRGQFALIAAAVVVAILAPICARLLYYACSRKREFLADAGSARFTRYPEGLASALEKVAIKSKALRNVNRAIAPLFLVNPLQGAWDSGVLATHPRTSLRVKILRDMEGGAGYVDYEAAFARLYKGQTCLPRKFIKTQRSVAAREAFTEPDRKQEVVERAREVTDLIDRMADFLLMECVCGVRIKAPPDFDRASVDCPRCGRKHAVPAATPAGEGPAAEALVGGEAGGDGGAAGGDGSARDSEWTSATGRTVPADSDDSLQKPDRRHEPVGATPGTSSAAAAAELARAGLSDIGALVATRVVTNAALEPLQYERKTKGWESFKCACGRVLQLSPSFNAPRTRCRKCRRAIEIVVMGENAEPVESELHA